MCCAEAGGGYIPDKIGIVAYPNPFNSSCEITISGVVAGPRPAQNGQRAGLEPALTDIAIYDINGHIITTLSPLLRGTETERQQGFRGFIWTPDKGVPSGIYLVRATTQDGQSATKHIVYLK